MFVSVEQGDITFYWVSVFEKVYLGITTATKTCYQIKEKMKPGTKTVEKCWNFLQLSSFFIFSQFSWISSPPVLEGGSGSYSLSISVSWFFWFSSIRPSSSGEMPRMLKKKQKKNKKQLRDPPLASYILIKSGRYFLSISWGNKGNPHSSGGFRWGKQADNFALLDWTRGDTPGRESELAITTEQ